MAHGSPLNTPSALQPGLLEEPANTSPDRSSSEAARWHDKPEVATAGVADMILLAGIGFFTAEVLTRQGLATYYGR